MRDGAELDTDGAFKEKDECLRAGEQPDPSVRGPLSPPPTPQLHGAAPQPQAPAHTDGGCSVMEGGGRPILIGVGTAALLGPNPILGNGGGGILVRCVWGGGGTSLRLPPPFT